MLTHTQDERVQQAIDRQKARIQAGRAGGTVAGGRMDRGVTEEELVKAHQQVDDGFDLLALVQYIHVLCAHTNSVSTMYKLIKSCC